MRLFFCAVPELALANQIKPSYHFIVLLRTYLRRKKMETTRLSEKGQVVIPKRVRSAHGWEPGLEFVLEDTGDGIKLKPLKPFRATTIEDVLGCVGYRGRRKSLEDMEKAIEKGARESL
jgi:AbrB family looped-hinge helix DNA binding protein